MAALTNGSSISALTPPASAGVSPLKHATPASPSGNNVKSLLSDIKKKSPSPLSASTTNNNNNTAASASILSSVDPSPSLKRPLTSPIAATNGSIPSIGESLNGHSMLNSMFPSPSDINSVANLALMQQLQNSSLMTGFPTGLESLFRPSSSVPSFNPYTFGYPGIPSPSLFSSNGEPPSKKQFDPLHSLREQLTSGSINGSLLANGISSSLPSLGSKTSTSLKSQSSPLTSSSSGSSSNGTVNSTANNVNNGALHLNHRSSPINRSSNSLSNLGSSLNASSSNTASAKTSPPDPISSNVTPNGSLPNGIGNASSPNTNCNSSTTGTLSPKSETESIKGLIRSYRESAAFLSRSADELEKLLNGSST